MSPAAPQVQVQFPTLLPWHRNLMVALFAAYVVELVLNFVGVPLYTLLPWYGFSTGMFEIWQPVTRVLVQGASRQAVFGVLIGLLMVYFFIAPLEAMLERPKLIRGMAAAALIGTLVPLCVDAMGLLTADYNVAYGWSFLVFALPALFGLARPDADVMLLFFPVKARVFLWGALVVSLLVILVEQSLDSFQSLGAWLGVYGWWSLLGPGARRRDLKRQAKGIERELRRFQVLDGGRKNHPTDNEPFH